MRILLFCLLFSPLFLHAQNDTSSVSIEAVTVSVITATDRSPIVYTNVLPTKLKLSGMRNSIPMSLNLETSVVAISESGLPVGNTSLRIRGTDATRTNITLNGLPLNDAESHEVFWVNLPNLINGLSSLQIQRGIGSTTHGAGAFGAAIHLQSRGANQTLDTTANHVASETSLSMGSYNTYNTSMSVGVNQIGGANAGARIQYNKVSSKGYIRNGGVNHQSLYGDAYWKNQKTEVNLYYLLGDQHTGITWEGVSPQDIETYGRQYNPAGKYYDDAGNTHFYDNESDNYQQMITQVSMNHKFKPNLIFSAALGYIKGKGFFNTYKAEAMFSKYGLENQIINKVVHEKSDLIVERWLSNNQGSATAWLTYNYNALQIQGGGMGSYYYGLHYGNISWIKFNHSINKNHQYYDNKGIKKDGNIFVKANYVFQFPIALFVDLQQRWISYQLLGTDSDLAVLDKNYTYNFFNPKLGISYKPTPNQQLFLSVGMAHREPTRSNLTEAIKNKTPDAVKNERLIDYELGYSVISLPSNFNMQFNLYFMQYQNQLIPTGKLTDVGYRLMENVKSSYRAGIELTAKYLVVKWLEIYGTGTLSSNKILDYTAYFDQYDNPKDFNPVEQQSLFMKKTNISYSPALTCAGNIRIIPFSNASIDLSAKYVGKQYYDNTSDENLSLPAYTVVNLRLGYEISLPKERTITCEFFSYNLLNSMYVSNAFGGRSTFADGSPTAYYRGFYPQAPINFLGTVTFLF